MNTDRLPELLTEPRSSQNFLQLHLVLEAVSCEDTQGLLPAQDSKPRRRDSSWASSSSDSDNPDPGRRSRSEMKRCQAVADIDLLDEDIPTLAYKMNLQWQKTNQSVHHNPYCQPETNRKPNSKDKICQTYPLTMVTWLWNISVVSWNVSGHEGGDDRDHFEDMTLHFMSECKQNTTIPWITTLGLKMLYRRGLIDMDDSSWLWFVIVVASVLMTALVVKSRSRNWKISIWFFVLGVTQNRIRSGEGSPESNVDQEDHLSMTGTGASHWILSNMSHKRKWRPEILSGSHSAPIPIMTCHPRPSSTPFPKLGEILNGSSSRI